VIDGKVGILHSRHLIENEPITKLFLKIGFESVGEPHEDSGGMSWQNVRYKLHQQ
jgi:hypothetical protein